MNFYMLMFLNAWMMLVLIKCKCQMQSLTLGCYKQAPNIRENKIERTSRYTSGSRVGQLMTFALLTRITNGVFIEISNKGKPMAIKDLLDYLSRRMT